MPRKSSEIKIEEIIAIREILGLTQAEAGKLLGGGPSAYAKYEAGTVKPSAAAANLLRLLKDHPGMLDAIRGVEPPVRAAALIPFEVSAKDLEGLSREHFPELLRRLLTAEAEAHGLPADGIHVAENTDAADGGEDGRITWEDGPGRTRFLPSRRCQFQLKSGPVTPARAGKEILTGNGNMKPMVRPFLESGGHYIMLCTRPYARKAIEKREESIRTALREAGLDAASGRIQFRDASQIASWTNSHPVVAAWVREKIKSGTPGPFRSWAHWAGRAEHAAPWVEDGRLPEFRDRLLEQAKRPRGIARIGGPHGVGKSRLTLQALGPAGEDRSLSDLVLYADEAEADPHAIGAVVQDLADAGARAVAVVNRCSRERRRILENTALRESSRLSLVTIDDEMSEASTGKAGLIVVQRPETAVIETIINQEAPGLPREDRERLVRFSGERPGIAILIARAWRERPLALAADENLVDAVVLGRRPREELGLLRKAAMLLAVFGMVALGKEDDHELDKVAGLGRDLTADDLYAAAKDLANRGIIRQRGKLIHFPFSPIAARLAERQWREWLPSRWDEVLTGGIGSDLSLRATRRLALINDTDIAREVAAHACREGGPLDGILQESPANWAAMLPPLAEIDSAAVTSLLDRAPNQIASKPGTRCSGDIIRALNRIAFRDDTFRDGARLLLRLAARSGRGIDDPAGREFTGLFPFCLGNTAADGNARIEFLDEAIEESRPEERPIIVEALTAGLKTRHFSRAVGDESHGSLPALEPWLPDTQQEMREYIAGCLGRIVPFAKRDDEVGRAARANLGRRLRGLVGIDLIDEVEQAVDRVRGVTGCWTDAISSLGQFLTYDFSDEDQELTARVKKLIDRLRPQTLKDRGKFLITEMPFGYSGDQALSHEGRNRTPVEEISELAKEFIKQPEALKQFIPEISRGQQRMAFEFGGELAAAADDPSDWVEPIVSAAADAAKGEEWNFSLLCGYLGAIKEKHPDAVEDFKQRAARSAELAPALPMVCRNCGIGPSDIRLVLDALETGRLSPDHLLHWEYSPAFANVPVAAAILLFDWLLGRGEETFRIGVCLLGPYVCEGPGNFDELQPQIRRVAENAAHHESLMDGGLLDHHFGQIMQKTLERGWQDAGARAVALALAKSLAGAGGRSDGGLVKPLLPKLLEDFTEIVWPVLGQAIVSAPDRGDRFGDVLGSRIFGMPERPPILSLPEETLFEWCREHPQHAPAFAASVAPVLASDRSGDSGPALHPLLSRLLDEFGERKDVQNEIGKNLHLCSLSGPSPGRYGFSRKLLEPLLRHSKRPVRRWAKDTLGFLHKQAGRARERNEEREARWEA